MSSMRDYQRMAPGMLMDSVLEFVLWNKVPVSLQQEINEITVGSVHEPLQKLLRAESVVQEQNRRLSREQDGTAVPRKLRGLEIGKGDAILGRSVTGSQIDPPKKSDNWMLLQR